MNSHSVNKVIGYLLLVAGLLCIMIPLFQTYRIVIGAVQPPQLFHLPKAKAIEKLQNTAGVDGNAQFQQAILKVLPPESLNGTLNIANWMLLVWIFSFGGGKLAHIGILLVKN